MDLNKNKKAYYPYECRQHHLAANDYEEFLQLYWYDNVKLILSEGSKNFDIKPCKQIIFAIEFKQKHYNFSKKSVPLNKI